MAEKDTEMSHVGKKARHDGIILPKLLFEDATIIQLFKREGNPHAYDYYGIISLLSTAGKILVSVL